MNLTRVNTGTPYDISSATGAAAVVPSDAADLPRGMTKGIYLGASGDVKVDMADGSTVTFVALPSGTIHALSAKRVYATGTTATGILGLY